MAWLSLLPTRPLAATIGEFTRARTAFRRRRTHSLLLRPSTLSAATSTTSCSIWLATKASMGASTLSALALALRRKSSDIGHMNGQRLWLTRCASFTGSDAVFKVSSYSVDVTVGGSSSGSSAASSAVAEPATSSSAAGSSASSVPATSSLYASPTSASVVPIGPESSTGAPVPSTYGAPTASSVTPISTASASVPIPTYSAPSARSSVATSVGAASTSASTSPSPYTSTSSAPAVPFPTGSPGPVCEIEYVYV